MAPQSSCAECGVRCGSHWSTSRWQGVSLFFPRPRTCCSRAHLIQYLQGKVEGWSPDVDDELGVSFSQHQAHVPEPIAQCMSNSSRANGEVIDPGLPTLSLTNTNASVPTPFPEGKRRRLRSAVPSLLRSVLGNQLQSHAMERVTCGRELAEAEKSHADNQQQMLADWRWAWESGRGDTKVGNPPWAQDPDQVAGESPKRSLRSILHSRRKL
jgi:hypothetical protein